MMTRAYSEFYVTDAKERLATFFDYTIVDCHFTSEWISKLFVSTGIAEQFERGNPLYVAGMSGIELAENVVTKAYGDKKLPAKQYGIGYSPEYWAGYYLAEYQWYTGKRFKDIFERIPLERIIEMYTPYHEMDISKFIEDMDKMYDEFQGDSHLRKIRENRGLSQSELSKLSGVNLRNIQAYEQRMNDIDKAQTKILYRLSTVLGCHIEDLLENPMG